MNKTKVITTIGPATSSLEMLKSLIIGGADVIRLNMSYSTSDFCRDIVDKVNKINAEFHTYTSIMIDIKGPLVRIGRFTNGQAFFKKNDKIRIFIEPLMGDNTKFAIDYPELLKDVVKDDIIKVDDGNVVFKINEIGPNYLLCEVIKEGIISDNKTLNVPGRKLSKPYLSDEDKRIIKFAHDIKADYIALPFVSSSEDILDVNDILIDLEDDHLALVAKIENQAAIDDIDNIIKVCDGVMIARGDLGVEIPIERIPGIQKKILAKCHQAGIVSIVATELLATMTNNDHPTRSEVSDIANAVLDGTDAVMLCGETTIGQYPLETLRMLEKVIASAEKDINYGYLMENAIRTEKKDVTGSIAYSVVGCASRLQCKAILAPTMSGYTAKKMSRFRPICPIIAISPNLETVKSLNLNFGVYPILIDDLKTLDGILEKSKKVAMEVLNLNSGDMIIITGGYPFKKTKHTNFMKIEEL